jgi:hypothetical protein
MRRKLFLLVLALILLLIAGAVGGAVGGTLAAEKHNKTVSDGEWSNSFT